MKIILFTVIVIPISATNPVTSSLIIPSYYRSDTSDFGVDIYFVGTGTTSFDELDPVLDNVYQVNSEFTFTPITLKINITGYTNWNLGNISIPNIANVTNFGNSTVTFGQLFAIVDNSITLITGEELSNLGISVSVPQGDHTVSIIYIGKDGKRGIVFAYDHITVRIKKPGETFDGYRTKEISLLKNITDKYTPGNIEGKAVVWLNDTSIDCLD